MNREYDANKIGIIYVVINKINHKMYVGQTIETLDIRMKNHLRAKKKTYFERALKKHGLSSFEFEEKRYKVENLDEEEIFWIKKLKTKAPSGYNLTDGGEGARGLKWSKEARKNHSINNPMRGKKLTAKHKKALMGYLVGHECSIETKRKISLNNGTRSRAHTEEAKKKMSLNSIKKAVRCIETGKVYKSGRSASQETGIHYVCISCACRKINKTAGKLHWEFV